MGEVAMLKEMEKNSKPFVPGIDNNQCCIVIFVYYFWIIVDSLIFTESIE